MSRSRFFRHVLAAATLAFLASLVASGAEIYVPAFSAVYWMAPPPSSDQLRWQSHLHAFNPTTSPVVIRRTGVFVPLGASPDYPEATSGLYPGAGGYLPVIYGSTHPPYFNRFEVPDGVVVSAEVEKIFGTSCETPDPSNPVGVIIGMGRVPLPVYNGLFPAQAIVATNTISLGNPRLGTSCATEAQKYLRRVNVTLFNGGDSPGTFTIEVRPLTTDPEPIYRATITLAAKEVKQINRLPIPVVDKPTTYTGTGVFVWMVVTCDQPFLGYASTIFDDPEPGAQPFEVFAFKRGS